MSTNQQKKNNEEEVDLGSLFVIIGKGFSNFFKFIGSIFKGIFDFFISVLLFFKQHILKIVIVAIVGFAVGLFLEIDKPSTYGSNLLVEPNFSSARQLYNNVNYYNDLVKQKDITTLQRTFNLDKEEATSLTKFEIEPLRVDSDLINGYNSLVLSVDTLTIKSYKFEDYKAAFTKYDYKVHRITVIAEKNNIFDKLDDVIISSVVDNKYFNRLKVLTNENLNRTDSLYRENLSQIDSLRKVYIEVMIQEAKKQSTGTNIDFGSDKQSSKELDLFEKNRQINADLRSIASEKSNQYEVINVISNFQPVGYEIKGITKNYAFILALLGAGFTIIVLLLLQLNKFLDNYKK
ncbi:hypothetical protein [Polaribacter sp. Hel_I_88]|uniref:hypothetical protein n=1 Tax=Polaribacter sp. Hel_I_88 TaxID=1250006 RepID=UPI0004790577|nr:hypothetical protein [Polaribacter sp. Hel_I_88]